MVIRRTGYQRRRDTRFTEHDARTRESIRTRDNLCTFESVERFEISLIDECGRYAFPPALHRVYQQNYRLNVSPRLVPQLLKLRLEISGSMRKPL